MSDVRPNEPDRNAQFATTQWSMIRATSELDSHVAKSALQELCQVYWYPLYAFVRRQGEAASSAEDITQSFFADLLRREDIKHVDPEFGKFRSFLLAAMKNFLKNEWKKAKAQKRGGGKPPLSIDFRDADSRFSGGLEPAVPPERTFEKQWALTLIERVNRDLRSEFEQRGKAHQFDLLSPFMAGRNEESTLGQAASKLGQSEVAAKVAVHRMRQRFGELLRLAIQQTVDSDSQIDDEIAFLFDVLRN